MIDPLMDTIKLKANQGFDSELRKCRTKLNKRIMEKQAKYLQASKIKYHLSPNVQSYRLIYLLELKNDKMVLRALDRLITAATDLIDRIDEVSS